MVTRIHVGGDRPYDVLVGRDLGGELPGLIDGAARVAVLYAAPLRERAERIAGGLGQRVTPIVDVTDAEWQRVVGVTLTGTFYCCRAAGRIMQKRERGSIVNISSMNGLNANALVASYNAAKAGAGTRPARRRSGPPAWRASPSRRRSSSS